MHASEREPASRPLARRLAWECVHRFPLLMRCRPGSRPTSPKMAAPTEGVLSCPMNPRPAASGPRVSAPATYRPAPPEAFDPPRIRSVARRSCDSVGLQNSPIRSARSTSGSGGTCSSSARGAGPSASRHPLRRPQVRRGRTAGDYGPASVGRLDYSRFTQTTRRPLGANPARLAAASGSPKS
jgi:hypothetical protein